MPQATNGQYLTEEPRPSPLDVVGRFVRVGETTFVRYDQIAGIQSLEVPIWAGPPPVVPATAEEPDEDEDEAEEPDAADAEAAKAAAKARVEANTIPDDAPRVPMVRVYLENRYGDLTVPTRDGGYTSTPILRCSVLDLSKAIEEAAGNQQMSEMRVVSGTIERSLQQAVEEAEESDRL